MANEITVNASLAYVDSEGANVSLECPDDLQQSVSTKRYTCLKQLIGTSATALSLGTVSSLGYVILINRDPLHYVDLMVSSSGAIFGRLNANGGTAMLQLGSGSQVPYAIAQTASCQIEGLLVST